ncbi:hypothetical protein [Seongchinamella sediminis]|uniref:hypothetical protein n=1 Tax=Seongchinamella sediminis TaxID=2283635 RepID=UPI0010588EA5|nr:hypothetical protein [Seongchinamella sediminis]
MQSRFTRLISGLLIFMVPLFASAQSAVINYSTPPAAALPVPIFGQTGLLLLGLAVIVGGLFNLRKSARATRILSMMAIASGLALSSLSGNWLVSNANALVAYTEYLFSENPAPVTVSEFPAELTNDLEAPATIQSIEVSGCNDGTTLVGTCEEDFVVEANGGSCTIESVCTPPLGDPPVLAEQCVTSNDLVSGDPWTVCEADANSAWVSADNEGVYEADRICQQLGFDRVDQYGGTCGDVCGYCQPETTSCSSPGNKTFDGNGDANFPQLAFAVMWTCVNDN